MASKNISSKVARKSSFIARSDDSFSTRTQTVITLGARKDESSESKKLASILEDSVSNEISLDKSQYVFHIDSSTGSPSKSPTKEQKKLDSALFEALYISLLDMQA
ncbi:hypothetical protein ACH5RR_029401 [Cinchona calisaya]|uniref:Uncharacterized protein n=1 Tax=Cinchona calisaya TaxID=153742 RepID=A0ABD2YV38_9GENT